jgi:hypothetical protein
MAIFFVHSKKLTGTIKKNEIAQIRPTIAQKLKN